MTPSDLVKEIDNFVNESIDVITKATETLQEQIYNDLLNNLRLFKLDKSGTIKTSVDNLKQISKLRINLDNAEYKQAISKVISNFNDLEKLNNLYFSSLSNNFESKDLYKEINNLFIQETKESLIGAIARVNLESPIRQIMSNAIISGVGLKDLQDQLKKQILGDPNQDSKVLRYITQQTTDLQYQYTANYQNIISDDLDLNNYLYEGASQTTTRCFCSSRVGNKYTKTQVKEWGKSPNLWLSCKTKLHKGGGRIPTTDEKTIFVYRGGYNCKHLLIPISDYKDI